MKLGGGGRFASLAAKKGPGLAAFIGRRKYGAKGMAALSHKGEGGAKIAEQYAKRKGKGS